jgi:hypothetical protein
MSLVKLFLSGLLVAGGLILGAFTLHGYLDPQWAQRQALAAGAQERPRQPLRESRTINTFQGRSRFVSKHSEQPAAPAVKPPPAATHAAASPVEKTSDIRAAKVPAKKKVAEKPKKPPQQQASIWPWNLFGN